MAITAELNHDEARRAGVVPLTIGVTGHRDLVEREVPDTRVRVGALLTSLRERFPDRPLMILSALAEGGDRLVAEVALDLGLQLTVVLPMTAELYRSDFPDAESNRKFMDLCARADDVLELPIVAGSSREQLTESGQHRNRQYAQLGVFLSTHSHILLALWDGKPSEEIGGTAQVVRFHHHDSMAGYATADHVNQQILGEDDSDLVYQVVVSRQRENGAPRSDLAPLDAFWLTTDETHPRTPDLPAKYADVFERAARFNRDVKEHAPRILAESTPLADEQSGIHLPISIRPVERFFRAADWLAVHYQRRFIRTLKCSHSLVFVMALMFLFYSHVTSSEYLMIAFGVCLALAYALHRTATRGRWHEKYLEYRTLAEALRVQYYWGAAGVTGEEVAKNAHDNFLQRQDLEVGWIRSVMRVAGIACDATPNQNPAGLKFALDEWIGDESLGGQLKYYRRKARDHLARSARVENLSKAVGIAVLVLLVGSLFASSHDLRVALFVVLGVLLLIVSIREAYGFRVAEREVVRQYEFMYRIFANAKRRLAAAASDDDLRRVLHAVGEAALVEHAEWILLHRERPLSNSQLWRMEG